MFPWREARRHRANHSQNQHTPNLDSMKKILSLVAALAFAATSAVAGEFPDISIEELESHIKKGDVTILDVNGSKSFSKGHIPGALDFAKSGKKLKSLLPKDKDALVVAYCGGPSCSAYKRAANAAEKLGYTNVKHLSAGISGWLQASKKTEKAAN
jgi:rhodanese-related sulfurtransferase